MVTRLFWVAVSRDWLVEQAVAHFHVLLLFLGLADLVHLVLQAAELGKIARNSAAMTRRNMPSR